MRRSDTQIRGEDEMGATPLLLSRRRAGSVVLAGLLTGFGTSRLRADSIAPGDQVSVATQPKSVKLFTRLGAGAKDGRDWQNAMPIGALSKAMTFAEPGAGFFIGFDPAGDEPAALDKGQLTLRTSGDKDSPLFVQAGIITDGGAVAAPPHEDATPFFKSARPWSLASFGKRDGPPCYFAINNGASHLRLSGFRLDGTSADGFVKFRAKKDNPATFDDIVISGIYARNVGRVVETDRGAALQNIVIEDCRAVGIVRGFARFRNLTDSVLRNLELDADNMDAGGKNVCQLIALESGNNVLFENVIVRNAVNEPDPDDEKHRYVQGDGIVCERKTRNVVIRRCQGSGMGDAAFDLKTTDAVIEDSSTDSCKFGARIWSESGNVIGRCSFRNPQSRGNTKGACIQASGTLDIVDTELQAGPGTDAIRLHKLEGQGDPVVRMQGGSIQLDGDAVITTATTSGVLELHNVMVNGVATDHRNVFEKKKQ